MSNKIIERNPFQILRKNIPKVLNNTIHMIISVYEIPIGTRYKTPKRVVYHLNFTRLKATGFQDYKYIQVSRETFPINKNPVKDRQAKYEIVGDFEIGRKGEKVYESTNPLNIIKNVFIKKNIDTIVITDRYGDKPEILYDATGYHDIWKKYINNLKSWRLQRQASMITGDPNTLHQMGYFNVNENDDRHLIEKMHLMDINYQEPPQRLFDFGKRKLI